ncbi:LysR family transcriptional regulator (chromosome initiation inhibitor) [Cryobacterium sp. MP_M5]|uniref:LysR family transcriptional regulator ArgP n=1 Tax=unclassified Cryobacterium TaxID=2649013 RepID=UPI0018CA1575|nr:MULTISPECIES: LysR family transcriptional regulator ArgP [unclassified Cryobacterium]MBG6058965.1 LysR family transcriptional regulator (chromosome initiation inhibitor) [Cryobacterium sp. MP_M3]MEC5177026.1 LysR family transcriptional regulator (chromosome initiation inhibitor) [Cryobacterium sp. MP_M5]
MMAFQLEHLHTLVALVEEGTFEAAAQRLRLTASAVSQRVKAMEQAAGQVLIQRVNPVIPTAAGDIVLRHARQVQLLEGDVATALGAGLQPGRHTSLPLAVNADSLGTWFLDALAAVPADCGAVFDIYREDQEHTASLLRSGTVMAAVTSTAEAVQGCSSVRLGSMRYRAVASPRFVGAWLGGVAGTAGLDTAGLDTAGLDTAGLDTAGLDTAGLDTAPMVNFDRRDDLQHRFLRGIGGRATDVPRHHIPTSADFARAVVLGLGWGLLPEQQCLTELGDGRLVELAPGHPIDVVLYWQRWNIASRLLDQVTDAVGRVAAASLHP